MFSTEAKDELIKRTQNETEYYVKLSIMMIETGLTKKKAIEFLEKAMDILVKP